MITLKQEKLADSKRSHFLFKIIMAGLFLLSVLPFSFSQDYDFRQVVETTYAGKHGTEEFKTFLDSMQVHGNDYFNRNCSQKACLLRNYGRYAAYQRDAETRYSKAKEAYEFSKTCEKMDPVVFIKTLFNLDSWAASSNQTTVDPNIVYDELKEIIAKHENTDNEELALAIANGHYRLMEHYRVDIRDYDKALSYGLKSMAIYNKYKVKNGKYLRTLSSLSTTYTDMEDTDLAITYVNRTLETAKEINNTQDKFNSGAVLRLSRVLLTMEDFSGVDSMHNLVKQKYPNESFYELPYQQAVKEHLSENYAKSKRLFNETLELLKQEDLSEQGLSKSILDYLSLTNFKLQDFQEARNNAISALAETAVNFEIDEDTQTINFDKLIITAPVEFLNSSILYLQASSEGKLISSSNFKSTVDKLDSVYFNVLPTLSGPLAANVLVFYYHNMAGIALKHMYNKGVETDQEFINYYLSSGKSMSLFSGYVVKESLSPEELEKFENYISQKNELASAIEAANKLGEKGMIDSLATEIYAIDQSLNNIYDSVAKKDLTKAFRSTRHSTVESLENTFQSNELVIDFFEYDERFYAYSYFNGTIKYHTFQIESFYDKSIQTVYSNVSNYKQLDSMTNRLSKELTELLPENFNEIKSLTVIPDGALFGIPFETMLYNGQQLLENFPVHYLNSLQDNAKRSTVQLEAKKAYIGYGLSYEKSLLESIINSESINGLFDNSFRLASLPNAVQELNESKQVFGGQLYLNEKCNKENFIENASEANILHIANHVLLNNSNSYLSSIVFAKNDKEQLFNALDIKALDLNAQLAILSSCNSGVGKNFSGNGLRSIGQSFFEAGCQSVIVNLWEAGDKSSQKIISGFMTYLKEGMSKSAALRQSKIDFLAQASAAEKHPKFWANIVLIGDDRPIEFKSGFPKWSLYLVGAGLLLLAGRLFTKRKEAA